MSQKLKKSILYAPLPLPALVTIAQDKGGEAKSLTALTLADRARLSGVPTAVIHVDDPGRLSTQLGPDVVTIKVDARAARRDPGVETRAYTPIYQAIVKMAAQKGLVIVEHGAGKAQRGALWTGMVDLEEELIEMGVSSLVMTPYSANADAMRLGTRAASAFLAHLPSARLVLIENGRDGAVEDLHPATDAAAAYREAIRPLKSVGQTLRMPLIDGASWRIFEAAGVRLVDVVAMPVTEVMRLTGLPRPEAKIARGDVAAWAATMFDELDKVIAFERQEMSDAD